MRACFLGQNICGLGFGVATLHAPRLVMDQPAAESPPGLLEEARTVLASGQNAGSQNVSPVPVSILQPNGDTVCSKFATDGSLIRDRVPPYNR